MTQAIRTNPGNAATLKSIEGRVNVLEGSELIIIRNRRLPGRTCDEVMEEKKKRRALAEEGASVRGELVSLLASGKFNGKADKGWELFNKIDWFVRRQEPAYDSIH